jgi:hypothetical protein
VLLGSIAKVNSTLVMVQRNTSQAFLAPLPVMDFRLPHFSDCVKKYQQAFLAPLPGRALVQNKTSSMA